jgi:hypothetical protein
VMTPGFRQRGVEMATTQAGAGGGWLVLTSADGSREALLDAGRRSQRLLLTLRALGIAAHPMTQMLEEPETRAGLEGVLGVAGTLQFLLCVGYVNRYPEPVRLRRPVEWFLARTGPGARSLRCLDALLGSFTPSMANISRPISPWRSQTASTAAKMGAICSPRVLTNCAMVVKCGRESPLRAMKVTCSSHARAMARLRTMPREYANSTTRSSMPGA